MKDKYYFNEIFNELIEFSKKITIDYEHNYSYFKEDRFITFKVNGVNGCKSPFDFEKRLKGYCESGINELKAALTREPKESKIEYLQYIVHEFNDLLFLVTDKEHIIPENEHGPEERTKFKGFVNPTFIGSQGDNPSLKLSIEAQTHDYATSWIKIIENFKGKIDFLLNQAELLPVVETKDKSIIKVFYSWQTDLLEEKRLIYKILQNVINEFKKQGLNIVIESDMRGEAGSSDIPNTLFNKISESDIFICDVNLIGLSMYRDDYLPNSNVMIELGYGAGMLGWDRIIMLINNTYNKIESLPFDIRHRSILGYKDEGELATKLKVYLKSIIDKINGG